VSIRLEIHSEWLIIELAIGLGLKDGKEGIQGVFQTLKIETAEIVLQAPALTISRLFKMPFQIQEQLD
jgi:hypothetical protein